MLQSILEQDEKEDEEDEETPDDETVNQWIARSEEEYELFQRMDIERRRAEAQQQNRKPRLIEDNELPNWLLRDDAELDKMREDILAKESYGEGPRQRKEVCKPVAK